MPPKLASRK
jgi:hypothetical protein